MTALAQHPVSQSNTTETMADLLARLGGVSPDRVRLHPTPGTATEADVAAIQAKEKRLFELLDGVLVEKAMGYRESILAAELLIALGIWIKPRNLGVLSGADGMMRFFPGLVLIPDVAFASWSRFPGGTVSDDAVPNLVPDLAVEVLSDSNTDAEMKRKRAEYFKAGVRLVWLVDLRSRTVAVYTGPEESALLDETQHLNGGDVLPGFTLSLKELFAAVAK